MAYIVTNWDNDVTDIIDEKVIDFYKAYKPNASLQLLAGLKFRDFSEILESLQKSTQIVINPHLLDIEQIVKIVSLISHPLHVNQNGATRNYDIRDFIFISSTPYEDLQQILKVCAKLKDSHDEPCLQKILYNVEVHFYGYDGQHYELCYWRNFVVIRHDDFNF